jgi:hypothetical protein
VTDVSQEQEEVAVKEPKKWRKAGSARQAELK